MSFNSMRIKKQKIEECLFRHTIYLTLKQNLLWNVFNLTETLCITTSQHQLDYKRDYHFLLFFKFAKKDIGQLTKLKILSGLQKVAICYKFKTRQNGMGQKAHKLCTNQQLTKTSNTSV